MVSLGFSACQTLGPAESQWTQAPRELGDLNFELTNAYEREDVPRLRELLSDAHVHNNVFGTVMDKNTFLADIESGILEFVSYETPSIRWVVRDDLAVATGVIRAVAKRDGRTVLATQFRFTRIYAWEEARWRVLLFHNTMVPAG